MIDIRNEKLLTFCELAKELPPRRQRRPVAVSTVHRWRARGLRGVRLEAVRVGGVWCTSWRAVQRFCERLTKVEQPEAPSTMAEDPSVDEELSRLGL